MIKIACSVGGKKEIERSSTTGEGWNNNVEPFYIEDGERQK